VRVRPPGHTAVVVPVADAEPVWLDPQPADGLRRLTEALARGRPQAPPYAGALDTV
jgi:hypothetical protein